MNKTALLALIFAFSSFVCFAQNSKTGGIFGKVTDSTGDPLPGINIILKETGRGTASDLKGSFKISVPEAGEYTIAVSGIGFKTSEEKVYVPENQIVKINISLAASSVEIDEVLVEGISQSEELRQKGFSIAVLESSKQKNLTADINQVIKTVPGIHLREAGGLGSGFKLSLNGLSGNQVRYFIDGIPMENFGSALTLNNYPINLIEKLEIYKGVVPVSLGSDALGGAINIVTDNWQRSFLDAAYSYGSFNTNRVSVNGQYSNTELGYFLKGALFYNHSRNNFEIHGVPKYDLELGNYLGEINIDRFHDDYTSAMIHAEAGLLEKSYADKLSIRVTAAKSRKNYQHPDNNILRVFGDFHTTNNTLLFSAMYKKQINRFDIKAYAVTGNIVESVVDTSSKKYNWAGEFVYREADDPKGELFERRSLTELTDFVFRSSVGLGYTFSSEHKMNLSFTQNYLKRTGEDKVNEFNRSYDSPNFINKDLLGISYTANILNDVEAVVFWKEYWYSGEIITQDTEDNDVVTTPSLQNSGYGAAVSYHVNKNWQIKTSFEKAYRIPESYEILGDGIYVNPNPALQPEKSSNLNFGSRFSAVFGFFKIKTEANYFYRFSEDFIRFNPLGPFGEYENLRNVKTEGIEASFDINYKELISLAVNLTYQNLTDQTEFDEGLPNTNYKSRVPNVPYFFSNARIGYSPSDEDSESKIHFYWNLRYVHEFFLTWENLGNKGTKNIIPTQFTHDFQAEYSIADGMYNFSISVNNLTDKLVYDNFNIQRPGRSYSLKFRYFIQ